MAPLPPPVAAAARSFRARGYGLVPGLLDGEELAKARRACRQVLDRAAEQAGQPPPEEHAGETAWVVEGHGCVFEVAQSEGERVAETMAAYTASAGGACPVSVLQAPAIRALVVACLDADASDVRLFNEQFIVKPPESRSAFAWHRDDDNCREASASAPYMSVWIALDDADAKAGCLWVASITHGHARKRKRDCEGDDGTPLAVRPGDAVLLRNDVVHRSGPNTSRLWRRAWMPQFSRGTVTWPDGRWVSLGVRVWD